MDVENKQLSISLLYRNYCKYYEQTANACASVCASTVLAPVLSEPEFELALSKLSYDERLAWQCKFNAGFERTATEQKARLAAALSSEKATPLRVA
ncbi:MAG: hypothetical protein R3C05_23915 [Pirellulaceae bacterium]